MRFHTLQDSNRNSERIVVYVLIGKMGVQRLFFWK